METAIVSTVSSYLAALESHGEKQMFRGQGNLAWPVIPSLARKVNELGLSSTIFEKWIDVEEHLMTEFKRLSAPWITQTPQDRFEWLVVAQHYGVPTVLLDMTTNPLKALFFAIEDSTHDEFDGAVYAFDPILGWYTSTSAIPDDSDEDLVCFYPKHISPRLVSQEACFVAFSFPPNLNPFVPLTVYTPDVADSNAWLDQLIIPKASKSALRKELARMGITHQTIFPGLDGIATSMRRSMGWS